MPLFGKKDKAKSSGSPSYPTQPGMASYPRQNYNAGQAPPPYDAAVSQQYCAPYQPMSVPSGQQSYAAGPPVMYSTPSTHPTYPVGPAQTVIVQGGFDAGARFDNVSKPCVPPPPPGCLLHPAQMAAYQGNNVVVTQKPGNFWTGGSDGGYTL